MKHHASRVHPNLPRVFCCMALLVDLFSIRFPYLARAARVLLSLPSSAKVSELSHELHGAEARMLSSQAGRGRVGRNGGKGYAEMALFLHFNRGEIPDEVPSLAEGKGLSVPPRML